MEPADEQEFNRLLAEGNARHRPAREALKSNPRRPKDWEKITPDQLKPAINYLREQFNSEEFQITLRAEAGCYLALHADLATHPTFKGGLTNRIPAERRAAWQQFYARVTEPVIFKFWCDQLAESLVDASVKAFDRFLKIGLAQQAILPMEPVEWSKTLVLDLLYSLEFTLPKRIKDMCDEQRNRADFANEYFYAYCAWVYWRAPRFVHMKPSGNTSYDPETAWNREDEDTTERLLHGLTERILDVPRFKVDDLAGEAYVSLASTPPAQQPPQTTSRGQGQTARGERGAFPSIELRVSKELPDKQTDLSNYFDQAQLTERQRECASLKLEYGMTVTDIADRLGITRKTVDEHLEAAERKIEIARARERATKQKSRFNPER